MSNLISRKEAIDALKKIMFTHLFENGEYISEDTREISIMNAEKALDVIENLPSAESERKKGQWSNYKDEHCCSVCKCVVISDCWDDEIRYDYCPYCGAEMS